MSTAIRSVDWFVRWIACVAKEKAIETLFSQDHWLIDFNHDILLDLNFMTVSSLPILVTPRLFDLAKKQRARSS
jgi:hypothetical protein